MIQRYLVFVFAVCTLWGCAQAPSSPVYDLVIRGGRVMDPASGLDGIRNLAIQDGKIAAISESGLKGERVIEAGGLVVAPGFIDLHVHGQNPEAFALMVQDGVTSGFELEVGTADVAGWYADRLLLQRQ